jgi:hypothetical protein
MKEIVLLQNMLYKFGYHTTISRANKDEKQHIININKQQQVNNFIENIKSYIIPSMMYKIRES